MLKRFAASMACNDDRTCQTPDKLCSSAFGSNVHHGLRICARDKAAGCRGRCSRPVSPGAHIIVFPCCSSRYLSANCSIDSPINTVPRHSQETVCRYNLPVPDSSFTEVSRILCESLQTLCCRPLVGRWNSMIKYATQWRPRWYACRSNVLQWLTEIATCNLRSQVSAASRRRATGSRGEKKTNGLCNASATSTRSCIGRAFGGQQYTSSQFPCCTAAQTICSLHFKSTKTTITFEARPVIGLVPHLGRGSVGYLPKGHSIARYSCSKVSTSCWSQRIPSGFYFRLLQSHTHILHRGHADANGTEHASSSRSGPWDHNG